MENASTQFNQDFILDVKNLKVEFLIGNSSFLAVDQINFRVERGETLGIVGESGSGKSVSVLSILNLLKNRKNIRVSGNILFRSKRLGMVDLLQLSEKELESIRGGEIGMIFQNPMSSLNPVVQCGDQVIEALLAHEPIQKSAARRRVLQLFKKVKLKDPKKVYKSYPHELSGGQRQRVMIAMALICRPPLLIADEPTTALDVTVQKAILEILQEMRYELDTACIFISHDLGVIAEIADRVSIMYKGNIVETGIVWEIFNNPRHAYTKGLLACRPRMDIEIGRLPVVSDFLRLLPNGRIESVSNQKFKFLYENIALNENAIYKKEFEQDFVYAQEPILEVKNLCKTYPVKKNFLGQTVEWHKAVDDVSFEVFEGETLGLVGESGCGKTTLSRTILQLTEPTSGEVIYDGKDISQLSSREKQRLRKDMQIVFQDPYSALNPRETIGQAIMEPMMVHKLYPTEKECREKAIELLETVNLNEAFFDRYPHEFSGGQCQRICIARALALNPRFIICDESVSALDVSVQATVLNLLNHLKRERNLTYIFISHDLSVVKYMADRILVMKDGRIVELDMAKKVYNRPRNSYTKELINAIPKGTSEDIRKAMIERKKKQIEKRSKLAARRSW